MRITQEPRGWHTLTKCTARGLHVACPRDPRHRRLFHIGRLGVPGWLQHCNAAAQWQARLPARLPRTLDHLKRNYKWGANLYRFFVKSNYITEIVPLFPVRRIWQLSTVILYGMDFFNKFNRWILSEKFLRVRLKVLLHRNFEFDTEIESNFPIISSKQG